MTELIDQSVQTSRVGIIIPWLSNQDQPLPTRQEETAGLAEALGCEVSFLRSEHIRRVSPAHLLPSGMVAKLATDLKTDNCNLFIVDGSLSPVQQRNLERSLHVKVIDRTGLILEIFGLRARTREGKLQVELARQLYERSRLVRTWTHLERQRGGRGFLSGPGESQLESDKRMLARRVKKLRQDLEDVRRTRRLQRSRRVRIGTPVIALVGYTNAGKSTLFNKVSGADVLAKDMPFATLDPTIRKFNLPVVGEATLVDTVGFISDLPTHLIEAFQATLEEIMEADLIIHVRDRASPDDLEQCRDVGQVLAALTESSGTLLPPMIEVWNKCDQLGMEKYQSLKKLADTSTAPKAILASATSGEGVEFLLECITSVFQSADILIRLSLSPNLGDVRSWLYEHGNVTSETIDGETGNSSLSVRLSMTKFGQLQTRFPEIAIEAEAINPD